MTELEQALIDAMRTVEGHDWPIYLRISSHGNVDVVNMDGSASLGWAGDTREQIAARTKAVERLDRAIRGLR